MCQTLQLSQKDVFLLNGCQVAGNLEWSRILGDSATDSDQIEAWNVFRQTAHQLSSFESNA